MAEEIKVRSLKEYAGYIVGIGTSISVNEFMGEYVAQARAATGWDRFVSKAVPKGIFSGILLYLSRQVKTPYTAKVLDYMGMAGFGTIFLDFLNAAFPGGIIAAAAALALRGKKAAAPVGAALQRIGPITITPTITPTPAPLQLTPAVPVPKTATPGAGTF
jgi:hypothetical protein